jgi:hypothetical protein
MKKDHTDIVRQIIEERLTKGESVSKDEVIAEIIRRVGPDELAKIGAEDKAAEQAAAKNN